MAHQRKSVIVIGGGNGTALTLRGLKKYNDQLDLAAVVSVSDSGGSSGALRKKYGVLPPGDILRAILALSAYDYPILRELFYETRLKSGSELTNPAAPGRGPNLGNLLLAFLAKETGDYVQAIRICEEALKTVGRVYPATTHLHDLCAELSDGTVIVGEDALDRPRYERSLKISRAYLAPAVPVLAEAAELIARANCIVFGPGSLYTSIVPNLLVQGMPEALAASPAKLVYVVGKGYELQGETGPEALSGFVQALRQYLPRDLASVIYHCTATLTAKEQAYYAEKRWAPITLDPKEVQSGGQLIAADLMDEQGKGDPDKIGVALSRFIQ